MQQVVNNFVNTYKIISQSIIVDATLLIVIALAIKIVKNYKVYYYNKLNLAFI